MVEREENGRDPAGQALTVPVEPVARLDPSGFDPSRIAAELTKKERSALAWFSEGGFVCSFRPEWAGLSERSYKRLTELGLFESHWTWASTTRPDTGLSEKGLAVRAALTEVSS